MSGEHRIKENHSHMVLNLKSNMGEVMFSGKEKQAIKRAKKLGYTVVDRDTFFNTFQGA